MIMGMSSIFASIIKWKQQKKQNKQKQKTNMICSFFKELLVKNSKQKQSAKSAL